jgi:hypothetical protein
MLISFCNRKNIKIWSTRDRKVSGRGKLEEGSNGICMLQIRIQTRIGAERVGLTMLGKV